MTRSAATTHAVRPLPYGIGLTICYVCLSVVAFYGLETALDHLIGGHIAAILDRVEWKTALPFLLVTSLLFLLVCVTLLHSLMERTRALEQVETQRLAAEQRALLGALSASVIHDCNNLLTVVQGNASLLEQYAPALGGQGAEYLARLEQALQSLSGLTRLFMKYAGAPEHTLLYDLGAVVTECLSLLRHHPRVHTCDVRMEVAESVAIRGNLMLIWSALTNLVLNAADATEHRGHILLHLHADRSWAVLEVHDNGPGVPTRERQRIFAPFHTTRTDGNGLGLVSVTRCMQAHGGRVEVTDSPMGGACFRLHFLALVEPTP
ncbi:MAG TPA: HAMP domain-containing sensor histidine kinase [bacterium]|nr:HAMP domain-containing sensor histidine kinase [bacterium]